MKRTKPAPNTPPAPVSPQQITDDLPKSAGPAEPSEPGNEPQKQIVPERGTGNTPLPLGLAIRDTIPEAGQPVPGPETKSEAEPKPRADASKIPAILLEGDETVPAPPIQPRSATTPASPPAPLTTNRHELPESYGTGRLLLTARDPRCLYAHWDLTGEQLQRHAELSANNQLALRVHEGNAAGSIVSEVRLSSQTHHSFIEVHAPGARRFAAELGYYTRDGSWRTVSSAETAAAAPLPGALEAAEFATLSFEPGQPSHMKGAVPELTTTPDRRSLEFPLPQPWRAGEPHTASLGRPETLRPEAPENWRHFAGEGESAGAVNSIEPATLESSSAPGEIAGSTWTAAQQRALAELIGWSVIRSEAVSSGGIEELLRGIHRHRGIEGMDMPGIEGLAGAELSSAGLARLTPPRQDFWFNVNAELVIYGATDPHAKVTMGGQRIKLRPDGSFSCRFALPDGNYHLPLVARSGAGEERSVHLEFQRATDYYHGAGAHPQDPRLRSPAEQVLTTES